MQIYLLCPFFNFFTTNNQYATLVSVIKLLSMKFFRFFTFLGVLLVANSCSDNGVEPLPPIEPITSNTIISFAIGNEWTYLDSLFTEDSVYTDTYTVRIESKRHIEDEENINRNLVWWKFNMPFNPSINSLEFASFNLEDHYDRVVSLQYTENRSEDGAIQIVATISTEYINPQVSDTVLYFSTIGGDALFEKKILLKKERIFVEREIFEEYYFLEYQLSRYKFIEKLIPGIGMASMEIINDPTISGQDWIERRIHLIDYQVQ